MVGSIHAGELAGIVEGPPCIIPRNTGANTGYPLLDTRVMIEFVQEKILGRNREFQGSVAGHMVFGGARITATSHHAAAVGVLPTLSPGAPDKGVLHTRPHATATLCGGCVRGSGFGAGYLLSDAACPPWILSAPEIV